MTRSLLLIAGVALLCTTAVSAIDTIKAVRLADGYNDTNRLTAPVVDPSRAPSLMTLTTQGHEVVRVEPQVWRVADLGDVMHLGRQRQEPAGLAIETERLLMQDALAELAPRAVVAASGCALALPHAIVLALLQTSVQVAATDTGMHAG